MAPTRISLASATFAAASLVALSAARRPADTTPVGAVLTGIGYGDRTRPFIDLMKQALAFSSIENPTDQNATVGPDKWPTQDFSLVAMSVGGGIATDQVPFDTSTIGVYAALASGQASVALCNASAGMTILNQTYDPSTNTLTAYVDVSPSNNGDLCLQFTDTKRTPSSPVGSGLVNISILQPGYTLAQAQSQMFTDKFLAHMSRFDIVRMLGWTLNGTQTQYNWTDRPMLTDPSWLVGSYGSKGGGVPWEIIIALGNKLGCDLWVNVPAYVTDDYLTNLATLFRDTLDSDLNVVIEYSNEVWNGHFIGHNANEQLAYESVQAGDPYHFNYDGCNKTDTYALRRYAWMVKNIADVFRSVYPPGSVGTGLRVQPVMAGQGSYATVAAEYYQYLSDVWGRPRDLIADFTVAPYFNLPNYLNNQTSLTVDQVLEGMNITLDSMDWNVIGYNGSNTLAFHMTLSVYYGIQVRGYEGGPDTSGPDYPALMAAKANATIDPRMTGLLHRLYDLWHGYGAYVLNTHQAGATSIYAPWGSYGLLWDMNVPVTPKTEALDAVRTSPRAPLNVGFPLPMVGHNASMNVGYYGHPETPVTWLPLNTTSYYLLRWDGSSNSGAAPLAGPAAAYTHLNVSVWVSCVKADSLIEIALGDNQANVVQVPLTGSTADFQPISMLFDLPPPPTLLALRWRAVTAQSYRILKIDAIPVA